ncbi:MAG: hypothetical protein K6E41_02935 [Solobacterium sp.]|nr:hypothetical protein [Solobacterium sp.]
MILKKLSAVTLSALMTAVPVSAVYAEDAGNVPQTAEQDTQTGAAGRSERKERPGEAPAMNGEIMPGQAPDGQPPMMNEGTMPEGEPGQMPQFNEPDGEPPAMNGMEPDQNKERPSGHDQVLHLPSEEELADNEEARSIVDEIKALFEKLKDLLGNKTDEETGSDNTSRPRPDEEITGDSQTKPDDSGNTEIRPGKPGEMSGSQGAPESFDSANTLTKDSTVQASYTSSSDNENAVLVSGETVTLNGTSITKTGSASGDNADFYGTNAAVLANNGASLTLSDITVTTDGTYANGVFSNGSGTTVTISDSSITTTGNCSGGLMVTGGGTIKAEDLTITTSGRSSAAIRSDRGGGTAIINEGTYSTSGTGSPAIYSTADIQVTDATLSASGSEAVVIEGGNSVTLTDCDVTGNDCSLNGKSSVMTNVLIYQSMSGDASEGSSTFTMTGGSLTSKTGAMFHVTNTTTTIDLNDVDMHYASDSNIFLDASADSWGTYGKNGGNVTLNLTNQDIQGAIVCDDVSTVAVNLKSGSSWTLLGNSYITSFSGDYSSINLNGFKLYINGVEYTG